MTQPVLIMAGGTGGHVFPALAVARELERRDAPVVWLGTRRGIEAELVPAAGIALEWIRVSGLRGKGLGTWLLAPWRLAVALFDALRVVHRRRPRAVLGMGGFASGPGGLAAWLLGRPLIIHEQNAIIGLTNRLLSRLARVSYFAFPQAAQQIARAQVVGNPVRPEILAVRPPRERLAGRDRGAPLQVLVVGGSLGARSLNRLIPEALALMSEQDRPLPAFVQRQFDEYP